MTLKRSWSRSRMRWFIAFAIMSACVDRFEFKAPEPGLLTVVEGMSSDQAGPYTVRISQGMSLDADSTRHTPISDAQVTLFDDEGNEEVFDETSAGTYATGGVIRGRVGHSYYIRVEMPDGTVFES